MFSNCFMRKFYKKSIQKVRNGCPSPHLCSTVISAEEIPGNGVGDAAQQLGENKLAGTEKGVWFDGATAGGRTQERNETIHRAENSDAWKGRGSWQCV